MSLTHFTVLVSTKKAWSIEQITRFFKDESDKHFDPKLAALFLDNMDDFIAIYDENNT